MLEQCDGSAMLRKREFHVLEKALGYRFKNQDLLRRALTHSSANNGKRNATDNERLEFVGDRVLGLVIAEYLAELFPNADEGELARRFNRLVRRETCARIGELLGLGAHLFLSEAEEKSGGRAKTTIVADAVEALLAAVFLDGGYEKAKRLVVTLWGQLEDQDLSSTVVDAKSALQEWAQGRGLALPSYEVVERSGPDHEPVFKTEVRLANGKTARGEGNSKRASEQAAAKAMLVQESIWEGTR